MDKVGLHKNSCKVIDVTNKRGTVQTLTETKISCSLDEKVCCYIFNITRLLLFFFFFLRIAKRAKYVSEHKNCLLWGDNIRLKRKISRQFPLGSGFTWFGRFTIARKIRDYSWIAFFISMYSIFLHLQHKIFSWRNSIHRLPVIPPRKRSVGISIF